jgi:hypothetical protein
MRRETAGDLPAIMVSYGPPCRTMALMRHEKTLLEADIVTFIYPIMRNSAYYGIVWGFLGGFLNSQMKCNTYEVSIPVTILS